MLYLLFVPDLLIELGLDGSRVLILGGLKQKHISRIELKGGGGGGYGTVWYGKVRYGMVRLF